jgi:hypothetical protein
MFSHTSYLKLDSTEEVSYVSLLDEGIEIVDCEYSFQQGVDHKGKVSTRVMGGTIVLTIPSIPPDDIIEWSFNPRLYKKGAIITYDHEHMIVEKLIFNNGSCVSMNITYMQSGKSYTTTHIVIIAEEIVFGNKEMKFSNQWTLEK